MRALLAAVAVSVVVAAGYFGYRYWQLEQMAAKYSSAKEVAAESLEKDGAKWAIHMESVLAQPIDKVWQAVKQPERSHEFIEEFRKSELKKAEGNTKVVEFQVQLLTLPVQTFLAELTYDDVTHTVTVKTLAGPQDQTGTYQLTALAPDRTLLVWHGTAVDKINLPLPIAVQKGALRQLFVNQVRAIQKEIAADEAKAKPPA